MAKPSRAKVKVLDFLSILQTGLPAAALPPPSPLPATASIPHSLRFDAATAGRIPVLSIRPLSLLLPVYDSDGLRQIRSTDGGGGGDRDRVRVAAIPELNFYGGRRGRCGREEMAAKKKYVLAAVVPSAVCHSR